MIKEMKYESEARQATTKGIQKICQMVANTYGPKGSSVLLETTGRGLIITDKSNRILQDYKSPDLYEDTGAQMAIEVMDNIGNIVGDGTTLAALLMLQMIKDGERFITQGKSPACMRKGLKKGLSFIKEEIERMKKSIKGDSELRAVIQSASQDEEITDIVLQAINWVGENGIVLIREDKKMDSWLEKIDGITLKHGYISQRFCENTEEKEIMLENPYVLITDKKIADFKELLPVLEKIVDQKRPLCIIADQVDGEALALLVENNQKKVFKVAAVKADGINESRKDFLQDIAIATGGRVIRQETGESIQLINLQDLGQADFIKITNDKTTIVGGKGEAWKIKERIADIEEIMSDDHTTQHDKEQHRERIGRLQNKIAIIHIGAPTKIQMREQKVKMENAIKVARTAYQHGILPGGGVSLVKIAKAMDAILENDKEDENAGIEILQKAFLAPLSKLSKSCLLIPQQVIEMTMEDERYIGVDVDKSEIIDVNNTKIFDAAGVILTVIEQTVSFIYEWLEIGVIMVSTAPDREDIELMKQGVPIMR